MVWTDLFTLTSVIRHVRYGVELEGPHAGLETIVLLSSRHHNVHLIEALLKRHGRTASHVWLQCHGSERYDWRAVEAIARKFKVTLQVRTASDLPPACLDVGLVWRIPDKWAACASACSHATWFGRGPFEGHETALRFRTFNQAEYDKDEIWIVEEED